MGSTRVFDFADNQSFLFDYGKNKKTVTPPSVIDYGGNPVNIPELTYEELKEYIPDITIHSSLKKDSEDIKNPASPGMKYKHYSPKAEVRLIDGSKRRLRKLCV